MQIDERIRQRAVVTVFKDIRCGGVFAFGGMVMMKCINDGENQYRNAVNLVSGNMYELHDGAEVIPINAILQEETKRLMKPSEFMTTMP